MNTQTINNIIVILKEEVKNYKVPVVDLIEIQTSDPFKVLVATILSARTKDQVTAHACRQLFKKVRKTEDIDKLTLKELEDRIYPVGFYKTKAKHLKALPEALRALNEKRLMRDDRRKTKDSSKKVAAGSTAYIVPDTIEELVQLPGVGRKTANLVVAVAFKKDAICVDTHVHRIMNRFGYVKTSIPFETELALRKKLPQQHWQTINSMLVAFGQKTCTPISPHCSTCPISTYCPKIGVGSKR